jgi:DNA topoisomerase-1
MKLIIVESPTKAQTLGKFLGEQYKIESSYGHIRDLPKSRLGIDIENNFEPQYIIPIKARKIVNHLKKEAVKAEHIILATDEDREGEAIAWHLVQILNSEPKKPNFKLKQKNSKDYSHIINQINNAKIQRITFHEITKTAIQQALQKPRNININLVNAQQARRVLDRLVGYQLSPFLWEKIMRRLSAGRVQSAVLRLIVERENEIKQFQSQEYWSISAILYKENDNQKTNRQLKTLEAALYKIDNKTLSKLDIKTEKEAQKIVTLLEKSIFEVIKIDKKEIRRNPPPPFITSTLQQEASKRLRLGAKETMRIAQNLYEQGFITYMRTDSLNLSQESLQAAYNWIHQNLGTLYSQNTPRIFKTKSRLAQEAHEAIRPTDPHLTPEKLQYQSTKEKKLYELIWRRFIASQLPQAIFDNTNIEIEAKNNKAKKTFGLKTTGQILKFDGFLKIWTTHFEEKNLPPVQEKEILSLNKILHLQHFTEPPPRYNEASLIKALEKYGIGRPSTYAPIISVIQERNYVFKNENRCFEPTEIGIAVNQILVEHFPEIVDIQFTAKMEEQLDEIAAGKVNWQLIIKKFYESFSKNLEKKYKEVPKQKPIQETTSEICEKCNKHMIIKYGRFGKFLACSGFPTCKNTKAFNKLAINNQGQKINCPQCKSGFVIQKRTKKKRLFYGCSLYPKCEYASWSKPQTENSPAELIE